MPSTTLSSFLKRTEYGYPIGDCLGLAQRRGFLFSAESSFRQCWERSGLPTKQFSSWRATSHFPLYERQATSQMPHFPFTDPLVSGGRTRLPFVDDEAFTGAPTGDAHQIRSLRLRIGTTTLLAHRLTSLGPAEACRL
jgi:hypothetical protein